MSEHDPEPSVLRSVTLRLARFTGLASLALVAVVGGGFVGALVVLGLALTRLDSSGALEREAFGPAVALAAGVVAVGLLAELGVRMLRRLLAPKPGPIAAIVSIAVSPWIWLGLASVVAGSVLVRPGMPAVLAGASVLVSAAWPVGAVAILAALGTLRAARVLRNLGDRSAYLAGAFTAAGLAIPVVLAASFLGLKAGASTDSPEPAAPRCKAGIVECVRLVAIEQERGAAAASVAGELGPAEPGSDEQVLGALDVPAPSWTESCFDELADPELRRRATGWATVQQIQDPEDLVQQTLLAICGKERPRPDNLRKYFFAAIANGAREQKRAGRHKLTCSLDDVPAPACELTPESELFRAEDLLQANRAYCHLDVMDRAVLAFSVSEGLDANAAAAKLHIKPEAFRQRLSRARRNLKAQFRKECR